MNELIENLIKIGCALSSERDLGVLLTSIVDETRRFTRADGGTLFLLNAEQDALEWAIVQNSSMNIRKGGAHDAPLESDAFATIPLRDARGEPVLSNVATFVAHRAEVVNIPDVYDAAGRWDFTGPRRFDAATGYRTRSILVVPLKHFEGGVIGVLQLINALDEEGAVIGFDQRFEGLTLSLASQAAVALRNAELFEALELQFEAFIRSIAMTIDEKSPYTAGHVRRVVDLTVLIARAVHEADAGPYASVCFSEDELKAMRIAAWLHDIGKVTTPEHIVDKATKLEKIFDRIALIEERFERLEREAEVRALRAQLDGAATAREAEAVLMGERVELREALAFLESANQGQEFMSNVDIARVEALGARGWLEPDEVMNLTIRRGTLNVEERDIIRDHARVSFKILSELPFSHHLAEVPEIAASHHEKLNGEGYPRGLTADDLSLKARILAVADIFEALTAADRPYKKPTPLSGVVRILGAMVRDGELDGELIDFALGSGALDTYVTAELSPEQADVALRDEAKASPSR